MQRIGKNQFVWGAVPDILKTINKDILMKTDAPIPVSSRYSGYPKDVVKQLDQLLRVKWFIERYLNLFFKISAEFSNFTSLFFLKLNLQTSFFTSKLLDIRLFY